MIYGFLRLESSDMILIFCKSCDTMNLRDMSTYKVVIVLDETVKVDMNFLEYPSWSISCNAIKTVKLSVKNNKVDGEYVLSVADVVDRLPNKLDMILLYKILLDLLNSDTNEYITTRYKLCKDIYSSTSTADYRRLKKSLNRLKAVVVWFNGTFYNGKSKSYENKSFNFIDYYKIDEKGKMHIRVNKEFFKQIKDTEYFKYLNWSEYKRLRKAISARLYEILIKSFIKGSIFSINIFRLRDKLTLPERYPSHILSRIRSAVNEINSRTKLKIAYDYDSTRQVVIFRKDDNKDEKDTRKGKETKNSDALRETVVSTTSSVDSDRTVDVKDGMRYRDKEGISYKIYLDGDGVVHALRLTDDKLLRVSDEILKGWERI